MSEDTTGTVNNMIIISRSDLLRLLTRAAAKGGDLADRMGNPLTTYEVLDIASDVMSSIPGVVDLT